MTSAILSRTAAALVLFGEVLLAGCSATVTSQPVTDAEHTAIVETITRAAIDVFADYDQAECKAAIDRNFGDRAPALTWSIASREATGLWTIPTKEGLKDACLDSGHESFELELAEPHVLSRDHAYIVLTGIYTREPGDGSSQRMRVVSTNVFERNGMDWKLARHHASLVGEER